MLLKVRSQWRAKSLKIHEVTHNKVPRNFKEPPLIRKKKYYLL